MMLIKGKPRQETKSVLEKIVSAARAVHESFTRRENDERAAIRIAEISIKERNDRIQKPVSEILQFCTIIETVPELHQRLRIYANEIATRVLESRYAYVFSDDLIAIHYRLPVYQLDKSAPDNMRLVGVDSAYLHLGLSPVDLGPNVNHPLPVMPLTAHGFFFKCYGISDTGEFFCEVNGQQLRADPITDILTALRKIIGFDFFEYVLLPHLENEESSA